MVLGQDNSGFIEFRANVLPTEEDDIRLRAVNKPATIDFSGYQDAA